MGSDADWFIKPLNNAEEAAKQNSIMSHQSQVNSDKNYLLSFIRTNEIFATYPRITMEKVNGINSLGKMPISSYKKMESNPWTLNPNGVLIESGASYDNKNVYLLLNYPKSQKNLNYTYHLRIFNENPVKQFDVTVNSGKANLKQQSDNKTISDQELRLNNYNNIMIITLPRSLFNGATYFMMSSDIYNSKNNKKIDNLPWRVFQFSPSNGNNLDDTGGGCGG